MAILRQVDLSCWLFWLYVLASLLIFSHVCTIDPREWQWSMTSNSDPNMRLYDGIKYFVRCFGFRYFC